MQRCQRMEKLLVALEIELQNQKMWQNIAPPAEALASAQPFCIDTLTLEQWLQFVLIPRYREMLAAEQVLPHSIAISPLAEEVYKDSLHSKQALIEVLKEIERV